MPSYYKLVRDRIPEIIRLSGKTCRTRPLMGEELLLRLRDKLQEETGEYLNATTDEQSLEELADVVSVIEALVAMHGADWTGLMQIKDAKDIARGGFSQGIFLIDADD